MLLREGSSSSISASWATTDSPRLRVGTQTPVSSFTGETHLGPDSVPISKCDSQTTRPDTTGQRTVGLSCSNGVHHPRGEGNDDEALVLEFNGELLCHERRGKGCTYARDIAGLDALNIIGAQADNDDLLRVRRTEQREERGDAADRTEKIDFDLYRK